MDKSVRLTLKYASIAKLILLTAAVGFVFAPETVSAKLNCTELNGEWSGNMRGTFRGPTTMSIKNCRVTWKLPDGRINRCRYKEKTGNIEYSCSLGSRGSVAVNGNKITMQNIHTAYKHGKYVVNVSRVSQ